MHRFGDTGARNFRVVSICNVVKKGRHGRCVSKFSVFGEGTWPEELQSWVAYEEA